MLTGAVPLIGVDIEDLRDARALSRRYRDQAFSPVDCVSFRIMSRFGIRTAFAFDHHFETVRVGRLFFSVVP
jgi:predicted nucleic acid-binding protein